MNTRSLWGWGYEEEALDPGTVAPLLADFGLPLADPAPVQPVNQATIQLPRPRVNPPDLGIPISADRIQRMKHTHGRSYADIVAGLVGDYRWAPDLVAFPTDVEQVQALLLWCSSEGVACVPFGGGTSVVGGVECREAEEFTGVLSLDTSAMNQVLAVDQQSRAAHLQAGMLGPQVESALRPHGLTLRHYPQSFEFSSVGGWLATRAGGHYASGPTHIDDFVESLTVVTPQGVDTTRRLPASGAGPSPDRWYLGSEGVLGVITSAWLRLQEPPAYKGEATVTFKDFPGAIAALQELLQSGLQPSNCRVLDAMESRLAGAEADNRAAQLLLGFESARLPVETQMHEALAILGNHRPVAVTGPTVRTSGRRNRDATSASWRQTFLAGPYLRDSLVRLGLIAETLETAVTWEGFAYLHEQVTAAAAAAAEAQGLRSVVMCRITHAYPDGLAPYYTVVAQPTAHRPPTVASLTERVADWKAIKASVSRAIIEAGGTITHHHAVGRDHREDYDLQRPERFAGMLRAARASVDPAGIMNPGVLV